MEDVLDQYIKNKVLRVIDFCKGEGIELFTFTDLDTGGEFSVLFDLDSNCGEYWQLIVTMKYFNFMKDDEIEEDKSLFAKVLRDMELLESKGNLLRELYTKPIDDGIFELRTKQHNNIVRVFFFFVVGKKIILTHGFIKTTEKTPKNEIEKAKEYKKEYEGRKK